MEQKDRGTLKRTSSTGKNPIVQDEVSIERTHTFSVNIFEKLHQIGEKYADAYMTQFEQIAQHYRDIQHKDMDFSKDAHDQETLAKYTLDNKRLNIVAIITITGIVASLACTGYLFAQGQNWQGVSTFLGGISINGIVYAILGKDKKESDK